MIACFEATSHALWLRNFVSSSKVIDSIERPIRIYCDNLAAVFFSSNKKSSNKSKYINIKYFRIREHVQKEEVDIKHISTNLLVADPITKALPVKVFIDHVTRMRLICLE